jgi:hypothetical protein
VCRYPVSPLVTRKGVSIFRPKPASGPRGSRPDDGGDVGAAQGLPGSKWGRVIGRTRPHSLSLRREGVSAMAVTLADATISTVDQQFALLIPSDLACAVDRLGLSAMD